MDRSLDDVIAERQQGRNRGDRGRRQNVAPRDGVRKSQREDSKYLDRDWVHDRFDDDRNHDDRRPQRNSRPPRPYRDADIDQPRPGAKLRVDNLHYDLTEDDLRELFSRIGPVQNVYLLYDRQDRSRGTAYVVYDSRRDAEDALYEYDGANAKGQPIKLTLLPPPKPRNPFDFVEYPSKSLLDRVTSTRRSASPEDETRSRPRGGRSGPRRDDRMREVPDSTDRYVPGNDSRRSSPRRRGRGGHLGPGQRRERQRGSKQDGDGHVMVQGRPRKTEEELDAEMNDYWGKADADKTAPTASATANGNSNAISAQQEATDDIDMIE